MKNSKKLIVLAMILLPFAYWLSPASGQAPNSISYQAVIRNSSNTLVINTAIGMKISILQGSASGPVVYTEIQTPTTNANGLVSIKIGGGSSFNNINWAVGSYYLKTETDPTGGTNYTITGTSQLLSVPYALHAKTADYITGTTTYTVGDFAQGGIVFWTDETGQHGLVCAKENQSPGIRWYAGTDGNTQAKGDGPFAGEANTVIIIAAQVAIGDDDQPYAARMCNELQITEGGKTYADWYLPSKSELVTMYLNKSIIDATALAHGGEAFGNGNYWSSCEVSSFQSWFVNFLNGVSSQGYKHASTVQLRAVRAF